MFYRHLHAESCELSRHGEEAPRTELEILKAENALQRTQLAEKDQEILRLSELLWGSRCVYCGEVVGKDRQNQDVADEVLRAHVLSCPKHPIASKDQEIERLKEEVEVGLQLNGSFFEALKPLHLSSINVVNPGQHITDLISQLQQAQERVRAYNKYAESCLSQHNDQCGAITCSCSMCTMARTLLTLPLAVPGEETP